MSKKSIAVFLSVLVLPVVAFAAESTMLEAEIFSTDVKNILQVVNLFISFGVVVLAIKLAALYQGGTMEKTWNTLAVVVVIFMLMEVTRALKDFGIVGINGLGDILESLFLLVFAYCLYFTRKDLLKKMLG